jgi:hypothetical protein
VVQNKSKSSTIVTFSGESELVIAKLVTAIAPAAKSDSAV